MGGYGIDGLVESLKSYREQMDFHILVSLTLGRAVFSPPLMTQNALLIGQASTHSPKERFFVRAPFISLENSEPHSIQQGRLDCGANIDILMNRGKPMDDTFE